MTKILGIVSGGLALLLAASIIVNLVQNKKIKKDAIVIFAQARALEGYKINEKKYKAWRDIDRASSEKIKKVVVGTISNTISTLNELFPGMPAVPAPANPAKPAKPAGN